MRAARDADWNERAPAHSTPSDVVESFDLASFGYPYAGQLTGYGAASMFSLGQRFREDLVEQNGFLSANYTPGELYVRTTDVSRSLATAQAFMAGLYPPGTGPAGGLPHRMQPIPVHTTEESGDFLLQAYVLCARYLEYLRTVYSRDEWEEKMAENRFLLEDLSDKVRIKLSLQNLYVAAEPLLFLRRNALHYPSGVTDDMVDAVLELYNWAETRKMSADSQSSVGAVVSGPLVFEAKRIFENAIGDPSDPLRLTYLGGHSRNLLGLFSALGMENLPNVPGPGAYASIALFRYGNTTDVRDARNFYVRVSYNGKPLLVDGCPSAAACPFRTFDQVTSTSAIWYEEWASSCEPVNGTSSDTPTRHSGTSETRTVTTGYNRTLFFTVVSLIGLTMFVIGGAAGWWWHRRNTKAVATQYRELVQKGVLSY